MICCALHIHILSLYNTDSFVYFFLVLHRVTAACVSAHADPDTVFTLIVTLFGTGDHILSQCCSRSLRVLLRRHRGLIHPPFLIPHPAVIRHISNIWLNKQPEFIKHHHSPSQQRGKINDWIRSKCYTTVKTFVHVKLSSQHVSQINAQARKTWAAKSH